MRSKQISEENTLRFRSLTFFYPSKNVGGAQLLFARIALNMYSIYGYPIELIDYSDGYISKFLRKREIPFRHIEFVPRQRVKLSDFTCIIVPDGHFYKVKATVYYNKTAFLFFWSIRPFGILNYTLFNRLYQKLPLGFSAFLIKVLEPFNRKSIKRFIDCGLRASFFAFMDNKTYTYARRLFSFHEPPIFLPIPIDIQKNRGEESVKKIDRHSEIHIGWISRLEQDKVYSLKFLINNIYLYSEMDNSINFIIHIFGDGKAKDEVEGWCRGCDIKYTMEGSIENENLAEVLTNRIDLVFAMGTAALEAACNRIPTVMVSSSTFKVTSGGEYPYIWLFESVNYSLGLSETDRCKFKSFSEIVTAFVLNKEEIALRCYEYCLKNHEMNEVCRRLYLMLEKIHMGIDNSRRISFLSELKFKINSLIAK